MLASSGDNISKTYFSPMMYFVYLFLVLVIMVVVYQYQWTKKVDKFVKVLVVKADGSTDTEYAPKQGGYVALKAPDSNTTKLWPINKVCAIEMLYPGDGFIPVFLQKHIKTVIVDETDWEPLLNRGSYNAMVASPDVVTYLRALAEEHPEVTEQLTNLVDNLSTAPTRDMVASPAVIGNIVHEKVSEMAVNITRDTFDRMKQVMEKLAKLPVGMIVYVGLIVNFLFTLIVLIVLVAKTSGLGDVQSMQEGIDSIKRSLGIP